MLKVDSRVKFRAYICCNLYYIVSENKVLQLKMDYESKDISKENVVDTLSIEIDEGEDQIGCCQKFCCCCSCCGSSEIRSARQDLSGITADWVIDAGMASFHIFVRNDVIAGILTYAIVFHAGLIITFINIFPSRNQKKNAELIKTEVRNLGCVYRILMYVPSFFPICSAKLRLEFAKKLHECRWKQKDPELLKELGRKMRVCKEKALWDNCCEAFLEAFPQAVLQIVLVLRRSRTLLDFLPVSTVFVALYGITGSPIAVLNARNPQLKWGIFERLSAYASNGLRVFSCALFIEAVLTFVESENSPSTWDTVGWIILASIIIFGTMAGLYIVKHEVEVCLNSRPSDRNDLSRREALKKRCPDTVVSVVGLITTLVSFYLWMSSALQPLGLLTYRIGIVAGIYCSLMIATCIGVLLCPHKMGLYHQVVGDVPVLAYNGFKSRMHSCFCKK